MMLRLVLVLPMMFFLLPVLFLLFTMGLGWHRWTRALAVLATFSLSVFGSVPFSVAIPVTIAVLISIPVLVPVSIAVTIAILVPRRPRSIAPFPLFLSIIPLPLLLSLPIPIAVPILIIPVPGLLRIIWLGPIVLVPPPILVPAVGHMPPIIPIVPPTATILILPAVAVTVLFPVPVFIAVPVALAVTVPALARVRHNSRVHRHSDACAAVRGGERRIRVHNALRLVPTAVVVLAPTSFTVSFALTVLLGVARVALPLSGAISLVVTPVVLLGVLACMNGPPGLAALALPGSVLIVSLDQLAIYLGTNLPLEKQKSNVRCHTASFLTVSAAGHREISSASHPPCAAHAHAHDRDRRSPSIGPDQVPSASDEKAVSYFHPSKTKQNPNQPARLRDSSRPPSSA